MSIAFVLDENLRGQLWFAIQHDNRHDPLILDFVRVGDLPDLPLGTQDDELLVWAERAGRIVVSRDLGTLPGFLGLHLAAGGHVPGILLLRPGASIPDIVQFLVSVAYASWPDDWLDQIQFIP